MVVEPVVVVKVDPPVVTTPTRAEVVMAEELASVVFPELAVLDATADDPEERAPNNDPLVQDSQWLFPVSILTCAVLRAVRDDSLGLLCIGAGLVGAVTNSVAKVGLSTKAGDVAAGAPQLRGLS